MELNKALTINEVEIIIESLVLIVCLNIQYVIQADKKVQVFIVESELGISKSYYSERGKFHVWNK